MKKQLGGGRLGAGNKINVDLHGYGRSTHNQSRIWRSTMAPGVLTPFLTEIATNGDTLDIDLETLTRTLPTNGPLFGSFKMQLDVFSVPMRIYNAQLHNNKLGIGMEMSNIKLPMMHLKACNLRNDILTPIEVQQFSQSSLLAYTGIRGIGRSTIGATAPAEKDRNALMILSYYDIFKNYYANKQEDDAYVIGSGTIAYENTPYTFEYNDAENGGAVTQWTQTSSNDVLRCSTGSLLKIYQANVPDNATNFGLNNNGVNAVTTGGIGEVTIYDTYVTLQTGVGMQIEALTGQLRLTYETVDDKEVILNKFELSNIDEMREELLAHRGNTPYVINDLEKLPYKAVTDYIDSDGGYSISRIDMAGLCVKTYNSDLFNNWLRTDWIDGTNGISAITAIDTSEGSFTLDTLNLAKKVYDMLNRIAVSGGTYDDWQESVYDEQAVRKAETPIYCGGMSCEIVFDEVVSTADATNESGAQALGTLAGRGKQLGQKGGHVTIKVKEPSVIMGIASITPRIDYSQGNKWFTRLETMDDLHKPAMDGIGFQELITEQMAFWDVGVDENGNEEFRSAGKQPAWLNYMTAYNETYGNFADRNKEMFMTLNRNYEHETGDKLADLTTYIDPTKFNYAFANSELTAQNFWVQIGVDMITRRKISAKQIPNL